jgi:hypothetical protein
MRNLVSIKTITAINPIKDADRIVEAIIDGGWPVVTKKEEFKVGDKCVYFEIDSIVPMSDPRFKFLEKNAKEYNGVSGARIRSIKLKKTLSQGLALPISEFTNEIKSKDIAEALKVMKWEDPAEMTVEPIHQVGWRDYALKILPLPLRKRVYKYLYQKTSGGFPAYLKKTDQERIQNFSRFFEDESNLTQKYEITIKEDGSSLTCYLKGTEVGVCSRNLCVWKQKLGFWSFLSKNKSSNDSKFYNIAREKGLIDAIKKLKRNIAVQGEYVGPSMNGNRSQRTELDIYIFDIWDIDKQQYVSVEERKLLVEKLKEFGYKGKHVHTVAEGTLKELKLDTIKILLDFAITTKYPGIEHLIEGVVVKRFDGQMSFKAISNDYLLKYNL